MAKAKRNEDGTYDGARGARKTRPRKRPKPHVNERMMAVVSGELSIEDLDNDELARGEFRAKDGSFKGRPTDMIPRKFYQAAVVEYNKRIENKLREEVEPSLKALREIRDNPRLPADARFKSAVHLLERSIGKVSEKSEITLSVQPWEEDIEGLLFDPDKKE